MTPDPRLKAGGQLLGRCRAAFHLLLGLLLAVYVGFFVAKGVADIRCPYTLDYGEGLVLSQAVRLAHGDTLYNDYRHYPYVFSNYPPVYIGVSALGIRLFGVGFAWGRAVAFAAMLGVGGLMVLLLRRSRVGWAPALGAPAFLLSTSWVAMWAGFMRVDTLALLLSMGGMCCVLGRRRLVAGVLLMVAATFTKQSTIAGLAAACCYLWWMGDRRRAVAFAAGWSGLSLAIFGVCQVATGGWFYRHVVTANVNPFFAEQMWSFLRLTWQQWPVLVVLGFTGALALLVTGRDRPDRPPDDVRPERLLVPYLGVAALCSLSIGKGGAFVNYMIEPLAAACLVAALGYDRLTRLPTTRLVVAVWLAVAFALSWQAARMWCPPSRWQAERQASVAGGRAAARLIAATSGEVIGDPPGAVVLAGRELLLDPATASHLAVAGLWDPSPLLADLDRQRFSLIFLSLQVWQAKPYHGIVSARWGAAMLAEIRTHYRLLGTTGNVCFLVPRNSGGPHSSRSATGSKT